MPERLAFDTRLYKNSSSQNLEVDLAALAVEAGEKRPLGTRIWPFRLELRGDKVVCPEMGSRDVREYYSVETELDRQETKAGLRMRKSLIEQPAGTSVVWLAGPNQIYSEGRVEVGHSFWDRNTKVMQSYGMPVEFSQEEFTQLANQLLEETELNVDHFENVDQFRDKVFTLKPKRNKDTWQLLKEKLPLGKMWARIEKEEVERIKQEALKTARLAVASLPPTRMGHVQTGAYLERFMNQKNWGISGSSCGALNSNLVKGLHQHTIFGNQAGVEVEHKTEVVYVPECGVCHKHIGKYMRPGKDHCPYCGSLLPKIC